MAGLWEEARLTACRRAALVGGEAELATTDVLSVCPTAARDQAHGATLTLTSHRLIWVGRAATQALALPLSSILSFSESCGGLLKTQKKIKIETPAGRVELRLPGKYNLGEKLTAALAARRWQTTTTHTAAATACPSRPLRASTPEGRSSTIQERTAELVRVARKVAAARARGGDDPELNAVFRRASGHSRRQSWPLYQSELARLLSTVCAEVLANCGPSMELQDLFDLHSRLHGIEEAMNEDVVGACEQLEAYAKQLAQPLDMQQQVAAAEGLSHEKSF